MARYILCNRVYYDGVEIKAGKEFDDSTLDVGRLIASGAVLVALPAPAVENRAAEVRQQTSRGRREAELDLLTAAFAEFANGAGVTAVIGVLPIVSTGGVTPSISINPATELTAGSMSAADKTRLDTFNEGVVIINVRNQSGVTLQKGQLVAVVGYSVPNSCVLVDLADKNNPARRPSIGAIYGNIANNANGLVLAQGDLIGVDTSSFSLTDQLVLGASGGFSRPPPDQDPFVGEVQNVGSVTRVGVTDGEIVINLDGLLPIPDEQFFAINGVPGHAFPFSAVQGALAIAASSIGVNAQRITGVADPMNPQDAATKAYVDAVAQGLDIKDAARVVSTAPIILSGAQVIDGVAVVALDRVLVVAQGGPPPAAHINNGIYVAAAGAWTRSADLPAASSASGAFVFVTTGTIYANSGWVCTNTLGTDVVGVNALAFTQFSGAGAITAGAGLIKTGTTLDVVANADGSIVANPDDIQVGVLATDAQHGNRGGGSTHANATVFISGYLSAADKTKLDGVANSATNTPLTAVAPVNVTKAAAVVGVSTDAARSDHKHDITTAAAGTIAIGDAAADGAATSIARSDHRHALPAPAAPVDVTKAAASAGAATTVARADHKHDVSTAAPGVIEPDDVAAEGTATSLARSDHRHAIVTVAPGTIAIGDVATEGVSTSFPRADHTHALPVPAAPANVTKAAASAGAATTVARADHKHDVSTGVPGSIAIGDAAAEGTATTLARSDHTHALPAPAAPVDITKAVASAGAATTTARADHKHDVSTAAPGTVTFGVAAEGVATSLARSDHNHALTAPSAPANVTKAAASAGASSNVAREDHKHDVTTAAPAATGVSTASAEGAATSLARSDHAHQSNTAPIDVTKVAAAIGTSGEPARADHKHDVSTAAPGTVTFGVAAEGTATSLARSDHVHALTAPGAPSDVTKAAASAGASANAARQDHKHDVTTAAPTATGVATASGEGTATTLARSDHAHQSNTAPANVTKAAAAIGTSGEPARADHKHDITTATAVSVGFANAEGTSTSISRADHVHVGDPAILRWGNDGVSTTTTTRYLTPSYEGATARTTVVQWRAPRAGTLRNLRIRQNTGAGNGNAIVYTIRVNSVASALSVSMASTANDGGPDTDTVAVAAGDLLDLEVTKAASIGTSPSDIVASVEFGA